jgi:16S rRNA (guanine966-N2)-methyltransferase
MKTSQQKSPVQLPEAVRHADGVIRIIGGTLKRSILHVLNKPGLRPTPSRIRETLFSWLGHDLRGWHCIDAFAGTGALGLEAVSRGAASVVLLEKDQQLARKIEENWERLRAGAGEDVLVQIRCTDAIPSLKYMKAPINLIFLDPPFEQDSYDLVLPVAANLIADNGYIYLESDRPWQDESLRCWQLKVHRFVRAGAVYAHLLQRMNE